MADEALRPEQAGALLDLLRERGVEVGGVTTCAEPLYSAMAALAALAAVAVEGGGPTTDDSLADARARNDERLIDKAIVQLETAFKTQWPSGRRPKNDAGWMEFACALDTLRDSQRYRQEPWRLEAEGRGA